MEQTVPRGVTCSVGRDDDGVAVVVTPVSAKSYLRWLWAKLRKSGTGGTRCGGAVLLWEMITLPET